MTNKKLIGFDYETDRITHCNVAPEAVCASFHEEGEEPILMALPDGLVPAVQHLLASPEAHLVLHNVAFDLVVTWRLLGTCAGVFNALLAGRVSCTKIREKLLNLADQGDLRMRRLPNGAYAQVQYDLTSVVRSNGGAGRDKEKIKANKDGTWGDSWRLNFGALKGLSAADYPEGAREYVLADATEVTWLYRCQERRAAALGLDLAGVEPLQVAKAFCLFGMQARGVMVDPDAVEALERQLDHDLGDDNLPLLIASGVLRPSQPPRPSVQKDHVEGCPRKKCACPPKMTAPKASSVNKAALQALVEQVCEEHDLPVKYTDPSDTYPEGQVSTDSEVVETLKSFHPVIEEYAFRQNLLGLQTREVPRMKIPRDQPQVVHPNFNELVSTGRTSCSASELYPSGNIQNVDPRARNCYVPRPGFLFCSVDYSMMELVTVAQVVYSTLGYSTHRDLINAGVKLHDYLGAQIALAFSPEFQAIVGRGCARQQAYEAFLALAKSSDPAHKALHKEYRTMAKPTGLGYPGGLGPKTFCAYARGTYQLKDVTLEKATALRDLWFDVHPDMRTFFDVVKSRRDPANDKQVRNKRTGEVRVREAYWYSTPSGMIRRGCSFTEAANGCALQSPGAELASMGMIQVCRAAWDETQNSILYGRCFPVAFIHDEVLSEVRDDEMVHEVVEEKKRLMVAGGRAVVPDVELKAEGCLMRRWDKAAEPVYRDGRLVVWEGGK